MPTYLYILLALAFVVAIGTIILLARNSAQEWRDMGFDLDLQDRPRPTRQPRDAKGRFTKWDGNQWKP